MRVLSIMILIITVQPIFASPVLPVQVDFRGRTAPGLEVYSANERTFEVTLKDGTSAYDFGAGTPFMWWAPSNTYAGIVTAAVSVVNSTNGTFRATFYPSDLNYTAGSWVYGVGIKTGNFTTAREGAFRIISDPQASGVDPVTFRTNLNFSLIHCEGVISDVVISNATVYGDGSGLTGLHVAAVAAFADITGQPTDNIALAGALAAKSGTNHNHNSLYYPLTSNPSNYVNASITNGITFSESDPIWNAAKGGYSQTNHLHSGVYLEPASTNGFIKLAEVPADDVTWQTSKLSTNALTDQTVDAGKLQGYTATELSGATATYYVWGSTNGPFTNISSKLATLQSPSAQGVWTSSVPSVTNGMLLGYASVRHIDRPRLLKTSLVTGSLVCERGGNATPRYMHPVLCVYESDGTTMVSCYVGATFAVPQSKTPTPFSVSITNDTIITDYNRDIVIHFVATSGWSTDSLQVYSQDGEVTYFTLGSSASGVFVSQADFAAHTNSLGSAAYSNAEVFATSNQGAKADTAMQPERYVQTLRAYHYGDSEITESPTNWFVFANGVITEFNYEAGRESVVVPWEIGGVPVTDIGEYSFGDNYNGAAEVTSVILPKSVTNIADYGFLNCTNLATVSMPSVKNIGNGGFANCFALASVVAIDLEHIGFTSFSPCYALTSIVFGATVPALEVDSYLDAPNIVNYVSEPTATGWGSTLGGRPVVRLSLYANTFHGNGSNLTGITAAQVGADPAGSAAAVYTVTTNAWKITQDPSGWAGDSDAVGTFVWNDNTRVLSLTNATAMRVYADGLLLTNGTVFTWPAIETNRGAWYFTINRTTGVPTVSQDAWSLSDIQAASVFWQSETTNGFVFEETHGFMPWSVHRRFHLDPKLSAAYASGLTVTTNGTQGFTMSTGAWMDEDIYHSIATPETTCLIGYRNGVLMQMRGPRSVCVVTNAATGNVQYDLNGTLTDITSTTANDYFSMWAYAIPGTAADVLWVVGRSKGSLSSIRLEAAPDISGIAPTSESLLLYQFIRQGSAGTFVEALDYRLSGAKGTAASTQYHNTLAGRDAADAHPLTAITGYGNVVTNNWGGTFGATTLDPIHTVFDLGTVIVNGTATITRTQGSYLGITLASNTVFSADMTTFPSNTVATFSMCLNPMGYAVTWAGGMTNTLTLVSSNAQNIIFHKACNWSKFIGRGSASP